MGNTEQQLHKKDLAKVGLWARGSPAKKALTALAGLLLVLVTKSLATSSVTVKVTAYTANASETDSTPWLAACGVVKANTVALSRDLFYRSGKRRCGEKVVLLLPGGRRETRVVWDTMARRHWRTVDRLVASRREALAFGVRQGVLIFGGGQ
jgi:3D (Asp-Asp-Asp) domain-containing protein